MVARGEVWWYEPPEAHRRPYVMLTRSEVIGSLHQVLGAPTTRTVRHIATEVGLDRSDGMPQDCVVALDNTLLIRVAFCTDRITVLGPDRMRAVCEALRHATGCS